jgi:hypothetical protein
VASEALEQGQIDQQGWENSCCDIVANAWEPIVTSLWSHLNDVRIRCRKKVYVGASKGKEDDIDVVHRAESTQTVTPLAVFEAKRWGAARLIAPDIKKLSSLPPEVEKFLLFYGGFPTAILPARPTPENLEDIVRHTWLPSLLSELPSAKKLRTDAKPILAGVRFNLNLPMEWIRSHATPQNFDHPWFYTIMLRVESERQ